MRQCSTVGFDRGVSPTQISQKSEPLLNKMHTGSKKWIADHHVDLF
jgi:hypothetical protein